MLILQLALGAVLTFFVQDRSQFAKWLAWSSVGTTLLFLSAGLAIEFRTVASRWRTFSFLLIATCVPPTIATFLFCTWFGYDPLISALVATVVMTTGTGVTVQCLAENKMLEQPSTQFLVCLSAVEDLPAALALTSLLVYTAVPIQGPLSGVVLLLLALLVGCIFRNAFPSKANIVGKPIKKISNLVLPFYFVFVGSQMVPNAFKDVHLWIFILGCSIIAIAFKYFPILWVMKLHKNHLKDIEPKIIAWGMIPRGVPGLAFALTAQKAGLINDDLYAGLVSVVSATTFVGLIGLRRELLVLKRQV